MMEKIESWDTCKDCDKAAGEKGGGQGLILSKISILKPSFNEFPV